MLEWLIVPTVLLSAAMSGFYAALVLLNERRADRPPPLLRMRGLYVRFRPGQPRPCECGACRPLTGRAAE